MVTGCDGLMDIEYRKRESVREWGLGKETLTRIKLVLE
jgi:hypothetical protein